MIRIVLAAGVMLMLAGCSLEQSSEFVDGVWDRAKQALSSDTPSESTSEPSETTEAVEAGRPAVSPCDGSEALEEVVRYTRSDEFPESGGSWAGVTAADNEEINPGSGYCFEEYAFGFLQPQAEDGDFNWVVVSLSDWETDIFPTDLECAGDDAVSFSEPPEVEEMLCSTSEGDGGDGGGDTDTDMGEYTSPPDSGGEPDTGGETDSSGGGEATLEEEVGDYYRAAGAEEWAYTYDHLASETRSMFTEDEWFQKNQWLWDRDPLIYHINSINSDGSSYAEVELRITAEDDSSWIQTAFFTFEDGAWRHQFSQAEIGLFMPGTPFDEFVEIQTGAPPEDVSDGGAVCAGVSDCETVDTADVDGDGVLDEVALVGEPDEYAAGITPFTVRVLLADGRALSYDAEVEFWYKDTAWHGATDFGQAPGEELVLGGSTGAHTQWFRVLTYRDGELVELPYPQSDPANDSFTATMWPIDAAASVYMGVACGGSAVVLPSVSSVGAPSDDSTFEGEETSWVLEGDQWRMIESSELYFPDAGSAFEISGWQCGDLPSGYD